MLQKFINLSIAINIFFAYNKFDKLKGEVILC